MWKKKIRLSKNKGGIVNMRFEQKVEKVKKVFNYSNCLVDKYVEKWKSINL